jgi:hypothetical protein
MSRFREKSQLLQLRRESQSLKPSKPTQPPTTKFQGYYFRIDRMKWVIKDKVEFESLVREPSELVAGLDKIVPPQPGDDLARAVLRNEIQDIRNVRMLKAILHASIDDNNDLAEVTKSAIDRECTRLILNRLWFRLIDDRRDSIAEVHSRTLQWAIHPPSSTVAWSDLSQWLRSEHGIYWISGKPGSGKSTLVKFLYNHLEVVELLETGQATGI